MYLKGALMMLWAWACGHHSRPEFTQHADSWENSLCVSLILAWNRAPSSSLIHFSLLLTQGLSLQHYISFDLHLLNSSEVTGVILGNTIKMFSTVEG